MAEVTCNVPYITPTVDVRVDAKEQSVLIVGQAKSDYLGLVEVVKTYSVEEWRSLNRRVEELLQRKLV